MKFRFQSFFDLSTSADSMQVIQWSVGGAEVLNRCRHLFPAYKYFKLGKISIKLVPASTLPVDPAGLSYDSDDPQIVDPRDQMNPGLVRITNGEDIFTNVSVLSDVQQEGVYNAMMLDPRWSKFMLQSGFRRSAYPLYWQIGQLSQDAYPGATTNLPALNNAASGLSPSGHTTVEYERTVATNSGPSIVRTLNDTASSSRGLFQVGHRGKLGFLPTDYYQDIPNDASNPDSSITVARPNNIPSVSVITCVLPKARKTLYYYRCFVTEEVIFAGLRSAPVPGKYSAGGLNTLYMGLDQFMWPTINTAVPPNDVNQTFKDWQMNNGVDKP